MRYIANHASPGFASERKRGGATQGRGKKSTKRKLKLADARAKVNLRSTSNLNNWKIFASQNHALHRKSISLSSHQIKCVLEIKPKRGAGGEFYERQRGSQIYADVLGNKFTQI
jgi:hypothetical protein